MRAGAARSRPGDPRDRRGAAGRLRGGECRRDPRACQRVRLLRVPDAVPRRPPPGLGVLEPSADAVGRHRTAGGPGGGRERRQGGAGQGRDRRVRPGPGLARRHEPVPDLRLARLVEPVHAEPGRRARRGRLPGRGGVRRPAVAAWAATVRGAGRRPARGAARLRGAAARRPRPGHRGTGRPGHPLPGLRARAVRGRHVRGGGGWRPGRADVGDPGGHHHREGAEALLARGAPARVRVSAQGAQAGVRREVRPGGARLGVPAGQPGGGRSRGGASAVRGLGARWPGVPGGPPA